MSGLEFRPMLAGDAVLVTMHESQHFELGIEHPAYSFEEGEELAESGPAWTAYRGSRIVAIAGFRQVFTGHAIAWATLAADIGSDHLAVTRFANEKIRGSGFRRLEAIVDATNERAVAWARLVGLNAAHELRGYGPEGKTHILFERIAL